MIRILKIVLVAFVALQGLTYFAENILNWEAAKGAVGYVLSLADHTVYPNSFVPPITNPALVTLTLVVIVVGELLVGVLAGLGALRLLSVAGKSAEEFNNAKTLALLGCGMALVVWFGLFTVIGGGVFQMWQTPAGDMSLDGAMTYYLSSGIVLLFLNMPDH